jgi:hypothetical protein
LGKLAKTPSLAALAKSAITPLPSHIPIWRLHLWIAHAQRGALTILSPSPTRLGPLAHEFPARMMSYGSEIQCDNPHVPTVLKLFPLAFATLFRSYRPLSERTSSWSREFFM